MIHVTQSNELPSVQSFSSSFQTVSDRFRTAFGQLVSLFSKFPISIGRGPGLRPNASGPSVEASHPPQPWLIEIWNLIFEIWDFHISKFEGRPHTSKFEIRNPKFEIFNLRFRKTGLSNYSTGLDSINHTHSRHFPQLPLTFISYLHFPPWIKKHEIYGIPVICWSTEVHYVDRQR